MKTKITFSAIGLVMLLIASLGIPTSVFAQQALENSITKDIPLTHTHIDGDGKLMLDISKDLEFTAGEIGKFVSTLSVSAGEAGTFEVAAKGGTIELLKPANSTVQSKALIIREIKMELIAEVGDNADEDGAYKVQLRSEFLQEKPTILIKQVVSIGLYNTTKSRINLQDWRIRFTYGAVPDTTTENVIDKMSTVDEKTWAHSEQHDPQDVFFVKSFTMSRQMDLELLSDPTKTKDEQLSAVSDGTRQAGWSINFKALHEDDGWIEIYSHKRENGRVGIRVEMRKAHEPLVPPEEPEVIEPTPPTDDR